MKHHIQPQKVSLTRREFLKGAAILTGVITTGSALSLFAPSKAWAIETHSLSQAHAETLLAMGRTLYPHATLPDAVYAFLVKDIDDACTQSADTAKLVTNGLDSLIKQKFLNLNEKEKTASLKAIEQSPFFQRIRSQCITSLYDNELAFIHFGYEGEVWSKGGYIGRGFNDIKWLALPPESASPRF